MGGEVTVERGQGGGVVATVVVVGYGVGEGTPTPPLVARVNVGVLLVCSAAAANIFLQQVRHLSPSLQSFFISLPHKTKWRFRDIAHLIIFF
jgi:hypothetical protein